MGLFVSAVYKGRPRVDKIFDVVVVGGGIGGLSALHYLKKQKTLKILCLESSSVCGGLVRSYKENDHLLEVGPNAFLKSYLYTNELIRDLDLTSMIVDNRPEAYHRYIYRNKLIHPVPEGPLALIKSKLISNHAKIRMIGEVFAGNGPDEESILNFGYRRFGKEITNIILDAMISGICVGDIANLDINSLFPKMKKIEKEFRSFLLYLLLFKKKNVKKSSSGGKVLFSSLQDGMGCISKKIYSNNLENILLNHKVTDVNVDNDVYKITTNCEEFKARNIFFATPAFESAKLVEKITKNLSRELSKIIYSDVVTVSLSFDKTKVSHPLDGFGFLVPSNQNLQILGSLFSSTLFDGRAPKNRKFFKIYLGGEHHRNIINLSEDEILNIALNEIKPILGINGDYDFCKITKIKNAIPQLNLGHNEIKINIAKSLTETRDIYLTGNYLKGISVDATIHTAKESVDKFILAGF